MSLPGVSVANKKLITTSQEANYSLFWCEGYHWTETFVEFPDRIPEWHIREELVTIKNLKTER